MRRHDWKSPFEILKGEKPDVSHLKVFGCQAFVYVPPEKRINSLSSRSKMMIYIGFKAGTKAYRFMDPDTNRIEIQTTAVFDEKKFPKCTTEIGILEIPSFFNEDNEVEDLSPSPESDSEIPSEDTFFKQDETQYYDTQEGPSTPGPSDFFTRPSTPEQPPRILDTPPAPSKPKRERKIPVRPGNVYGEQRNPTDLQKQDRRRKLGMAIEGQPLFDQLLASAVEQIPAIAFDNRVVDMQHWDISKLQSKADRDAWYQAEEVEIALLNERGVIKDLIPLPKDRKAITCK
jgi:hypothetical protein